APVAARMTDVISDDNLPHSQSGKTFTSTVPDTGESGLMVNAPKQDWSIGGTSADPLDFASTLRNSYGFSTLYVALDKLPQGFSVRSHQSSANFVDILGVAADGAAVIGTLSVTASNTGRIGTNDIKTVSGAGSS